MTYEYLSANWEGIALIIFFGAMLAGASIFTIRNARRERAKAREEAENKKHEGEYRVIRTKDKTYWVQQFVFDYPDKQYYPPNDPNGGNAYFTCWHWKFLSGYSYKISAIQYLERAMQADVSDAKRKAMEDAIECERRENLKVVEMVDYKITDAEYLALLKDRNVFRARGLQCNPLSEAHAIQMPRTDADTPPKLNYLDDGTLPPMGGFHDI